MRQTSLLFSSMPNRFIASVALRLKAGAQGRSGICSLLLLQRISWRIGEQITRLIAACHGNRIGRRI